MNIYAHKHAHGFRKYTHISQISAKNRLCKDVHIHMYIEVCIYIYYMYTYIYIYLFIFVCIYICVYLYICIYINIQIHLYHALMELRIEPNICQSYAPMRRSRGAPTLRRVAWEPRNEPRKEV